MVTCNTCCIIQRSQFWCYRQLLYKVSWVVHVYQVNDIRCTLLEVLRHVYIALCSKYLAKSTGYECSYVFCVNEFLCENVEYKALNMVTCQYPAPHSHEIVHGIYIVYAVSNSHAYFIFEICQEILLKLTGMLSNLIFIRLLFINC